MKCRSAALLLCCFMSLKAGAQELFTYTEPASNMPARAIGLRASNWLMRETDGGRLNYHLIPELMWGVNRNFMLHLEGFISNRAGGRLAGEGAALYGKYRFYSRDEVHRHLRAALFGRLAWNNAIVHQDEVETNGHNSGGEAGLIVTQLLHKTALSATLSYEHAVITNGTEAGYGGYGGKAVNYAFSLGQLVLPRAYTGYRQTNFNLMLELLGQTLPGEGKSYLDIAPSLQLIFNSQTRVDIGYRQQLYGNMARTAPNGFLLRVEHVLFNAL